MLLRLCGGKDFRQVLTEIGKDGFLLLDGSASVLHYFADLLLDPLYYCCDGLEVVICGSEYAQAFRQTAEPADLQQQKVVQILNKSGFIIGYETNIQDVSLFIVAVLYGWLSAGHINFPFCRFRRLG